MEHTHFKQRDKAAACAVSRRVPNMAEDGRSAIWMTARIGVDVFLRKAAKHPIKTQKYSTGVTVESFRLELIKLRIEQTHARKSSSNCKKRRETILAHKERAKNTHYPIRGVLDRKLPQEQSSLFEMPFGANISSSTFWRHFVKSIA